MSHGNSRPAAARRSNSPSLVRASFGSHRLRLRSRSRPTKTPGSELAVHPTQRPAGVAAPDPASLPVQLAVPRWALLQARLAAQASRPDPGSTARTQRGAARLRQRSAERSAQPQPSRTQPQSGMEVTDASTTIRRAYTPHFRPRDPTVELRRPVTRAIGPSVLIGRYPIGG